MKTLNEYINKIRTFMLGNDKQLEVVKPEPTPEPIVKVEKPKRGRKKKEVKDE